MLIIRYYEFILCSVSFGIDYENDYTFIHARFELLSLGLMIIVFWVVTQVFQNVFSFLPTYTAT